MSARPGRSNRLNNLQLVTGDQPAMMDVNQIRMLAAQQEAMEHQKTMQAQQLVTAQSSVALDAAKFIVGNGERFDDEDVVNAKDIVRNIAMFYAPRAVIPPGQEPKPEGEEEAETLPEHASEAPDAPAKE